MGETFPWYVIGFVVVVLVLTIGGTVLKRYLVGKARVYGDERRGQRMTSKGDTVAGQLSGSVVLATDVDSALPLISPVLDATRGVKQTERYRWAQAKWALDEALRYELVATPAGAELYVSQALESQTGIDGEKTWRKIREQVAAAATAAGIAATQGQRPLQRVGADANGTPLWRAA